MCCQQYEPPIEICIFLWKFWFAFDSLNTLQTKSESMISNLYLYCLFGDAGLRLAARSLGKARNSSSSVFWLLNRWCRWSRVLSEQSTVLRTILWQRASSLNRTWGCGPVGWVSAGVRPVNKVQAWVSQYTKYIRCLNRDFVLCDSRMGKSKHSRHVSIFTRI